MKSSFDMRAKQPEKKYLLILLSFLDYEHFLEMDFTSNVTYRKRFLSFVGVVVVVGIIVVIGFYFWNKLRNFLRFICSKPATRQW